MEFNKQELEIIYYSLKRVTELFEDDLEMLHDGGDEETEAIIVRYKTLQSRIKELST